MKRTLTIAGTLLLLSAPLLAEPSPAALATFNTYAAQVESRLARQHRTPDTFLALDPAQRARVRSGELLIEHLPTPAAPDALLHHWRATAFVPNTGVPGEPEGRWSGNATPAAFEHLLRDLPAYPTVFAPQVLSATVVSQTPTHTLLRLRTRQHHVLTVVLDTTCDVTFATLDSTHAESTSRSTRVDQIAPAGDDGFLYRLNTYWSWEQRDGGLYLQLESLSLTRSIPRGLAWAIQPFLESVPRDSLVFTLTSARNALTSNR